MTTELEDRICEALRARAGSTTFTSRMAPLVALSDVRWRRGPRRGLLAVATVAFVALLVGALAVASDRGSEPDDAAGPASVDVLVPPGFGADITDSRSTTESKVFAAVVAEAIETRGWDLTEREHATRTTAAGRRVEWAYFAESNTRLFVAVGDADLMDSVPDVRAQLRNEQTANGALLVWPEMTATRTIALVQLQRTLIVRSEAIDADGTARPLSELVTLAENVASDLDAYAPETTTANTSEVVIPPADGPDDDRGPIERFIGLPRDLNERTRVIQTATQQAIVECMAGAGFQYVPEPTDANVAIQLSLTPEELGRYHSTMGGDNGCERSAAARTFLANRYPTEWTALQQQLNNDPRNIAANQAFISCLADAGYTNAHDAPESTRNQCAASTDITRIGREVAEDIETSWIRDHRQQLAAMRDDIETLVVNAAAATP